MTSVCLFRQALALDERRVKFIPEYAYGATTLRPKDHPTMTKEQPATPKDQPATPKDQPATTTDQPTTTKDPSEVKKVQLKIAKAQLPHTKEVWFVGSHADMYV